MREAHKNRGTGKTRFTAQLSEAWHGHQAAPF